MRYRVPQNIDMEDKIIGPLTMAQFVFVLIGGMLVYIDFVTLGTSLPFLFWASAIPIGLITLAFGFGKVQDQPFPKFLASVLLYLTRPKSRIWQKDPASNHLNVVTKTATTPEQPSVPGDTLGRHDVAGLASVLDTAKESGIRNNELGDQPGQPPALNNESSIMNQESINQPTSIGRNVNSQLPPDRRAGTTHNSQVEEASPYHSAPPLPEMTQSNNESRMTNDETISKLEIRNSKFDDGSRL